MILWVFAAFACPERSEILDRAQQALMDFDDAGLEQAHTEFRASLGCGAPVAPDVLQRFWVQAGVAAVVRADETAADEAFGDARRFGPVELGPFESVAARHLGRVVAETDTQPVHQLSMQPWPPSPPVVDGVPWAQPRLVEPGRYVVQFTGAESVLAHQVVAVRNLDLEVRTPQLALETPRTRPETVVDPAEPRRRRRWAPFVVGTGVAVAGAGVLLAGELPRRAAGNLDETASFTDVKRLRTQHIALRSLGAGLAGAGAVTMGVSIALGGR